jgi:Protein of unknown function (DUF4089)
MKRKPNRKSRSGRAKKTGRSRFKVFAPRQARVHDTVDALVKASAQALGISLDPAWREGIGFNLRLILRHAKLVDQFALPDRTEPALVFYA